jgi:dipeptidyl aminopeptidase/acylaminoacyl peptidase
LTWVGSGKPYEDLAEGIDYLMENEDYNYIDFDHMVALGASYGGYMVSTKLKSMHGTA